MVAWLNYRIFSANSLGKFQLTLLPEIAILQGIGLAKSSPEPSDTLQDFVPVFGLHHPARQAGCQGMVVQSISTQLRSHKILDKIQMLFIERPEGLAATGSLQPEWQSEI